MTIRRFIYLKSGIFCKTQPKSRLSICELIFYYKYLSFKMIDFRLSEKRDFFDKRRSCESAEIEP